MGLESVGKRYGLRQPWVVRSVSLDVLPAAARWPGAVSLIAATALLLITWTPSALAAARRERSLS